MGLTPLLFEGGTGNHTAFVASDGNGNVTALTDATTSGLVAQYEYGPFGELIRAAGIMQQSNPFRFSTKFQDDESDLLAYGNRYYNSIMGRWLTRDIINEKAFQRIVLKASFAKDEIVLLKTNDVPGSDFLFVYNNPVDSYDKLGLDADITWNPAPTACPKGQVVVFIQVAYGGFYRTPVVDDGSHGFAATGTGCSEYPNFGHEGDFEDSPGGLGTASTFITAMACAQPCCGASQPDHAYRRIVSIGPMVTWHKGDQGSINGTASLPPFAVSSATDAATFNAALNRDYPQYKSCYTCYHKSKK